MDLFSNTPVTQYRPEEAAEEIRMESVKKAKTLIVLCG